MVKNRVQNLFLSGPGIDVVHTDTFGKIANHILHRLGFAVCFQYLFGQLDRRMGGLAA